MWTLPSILLTGCVLGNLAAHAGVVVYPDDTIGTATDAWSTTDPGIAGWYYGDIRNSGTVGITRSNDRTSSEAATNYPGSSGSLEFVLTGGSDKAGFNLYFDPTVTSIRLADIESMSYDWYRDSSSSNPAVQVPALFMWVDRDGDLNTADVVGIKYETVYNDYPAGAPTNSWQTSTISDQTNLWSWNAPGYAWVFYGYTLSFWKSTYPDGVVIGIGVDAGSGWNGFFLGNVDFITIDLVGTDNDLFYDFQVAPAFVVIGDCETNVVDHVVDGTLTISDLIQVYMDQASNHGEFVRSVADLATWLKDEGIISGRDRGALVSCAAKYKGF